MDGVMFNLEVCDTSDQRQMCPIIAYHSFTQFLSGSPQEV